jgi:hypothetical protein
VLLEGPGADRRKSASKSPEAACTLARAIGDDGLLGIVWVGEDEEETSAGPSVEETRTVEVEGLICCNTRE